MLYGGIRCAEVSSWIFEDVKKMINDKTLKEIGNKSNAKRMVPAAVALIFAVAVMNVGVASAQTFLFTFGSFGHGDGQFNLEINVAVDSSGNIYVSDLNNNRIQVFGVTPGIPEFPTIALPVGAAIGLLLFFQRRKTPT